MTKTNQPERRGDHWVLYRPDDGSEFLCPTSAPISPYLRRGYSTRPLVSDLDRTMARLDALGIREGIWSGRPAVLLGGGPSLATVPPTTWEGHLVIACNRAYEVDQRIAVWLTLDRRYLDALRRGDYGTQELDMWRALDAARLSVTTEGYPPADGVAELPRGATHGVSRSLRDGIATGDNTGYVALQLALLLGASPIYLVGYDMRPGHGHSGHLWPSDPACYGRDAAAYEAAAAEMLRRADIRHLRTDSLLSCFGRVDELPEAPRGPLWISAHTPDALYSRHAASLRQSLALYGQRAVVETLEDGGSWTANTQAKAALLRAARDRHEGPLVWTDADSRLDGWPALLYDGSLDGHDLAVCHRGGTELLSGTIWIADTKRARAARDAWVDECAREPTTWDQHALQRVITRKRVRGLRVAALPPEYCCIADGATSMRGDCRSAPVVLHYQASREARRQERP